MPDKTRILTGIIEPQYVIEGAGVLLRRSFGPSRANPYDPFLLFDHFAFNDPVEGPIRGFPTHPHRGIETVTYMLEGSVRHRDSLGNMGIIGAGAVQWMTSGRGILHEEMPQRSPQGRVDGFQLWVNLPATRKMSQPRYQEVSAGDIPAATRDGASVRVVAGECGGVRGPVGEIAAQPLYMEVRLEPGARFHLPTPFEHALIAYLFEGEALLPVDEEGAFQPAPAVRMLVFGEGEAFEIRASDAAPARFMLMAGAPFKEAIVPYGPFVMNTAGEIQQALADLRNGTFVQDPAISMA
ncbi:MAG: pirin family protein [Anaerolineales bacterium]|nr:pirin family protein [Anaerolineales bacterium]